MATVYYASLAALQTAMPVSVQRYMVVDPDSGFVSTVGALNLGVLQLYVAAPGEQINPASLVGAITVTSIRE